MHPTSFSHIKITSCGMMTVNMYRDRHSGLGKMRLEVNAEERHVARLVCVQGDWVSFGRAGKMSPAVACNSGGCRGEVWSVSLSTS